MMLEWRIAERLNGAWHGMMFLENLTYKVAVASLDYLTRQQPEGEYRLEFRRVPEWEPY